ncbi:putative malate:quinone oxidoreductase, partial [Pseudomonas syringae pv. spinaceae]
DEDQGGVLKLGTEVVASKDGSIAGLLGASPGASTAAPIMLDLMQKVFKNKLASAPWQDKLRQIVPSYGTHLNEDPDKVVEEWRYTSELLQLTPP